MTVLDTSSPASRFSDFGNFSARRVWDKIRPICPWPRPKITQNNSKPVCLRTIAAAPSRWHALQFRFRKMPLWTRYGAITILLIAIIFAVYAAIPGTSSSADHLPA